MATFTNQPISASYQRVLQIDGGQIQDGLGNAVTASILGISASQGFTGSLQGTASFAISSSISTRAVSASFATTASHLTGTVTSASYALTASYVSGSSLTASYALTASYVNTLVQDVIISGSVSISGSLTVSGSNTFTNIGPTIFSGSVTSVGGFTGSLEGTATTASYAVTASFLTVDATASYALTASFLAGTIESASFAQNAQTASYILNAVSSSFALTASYALNAGSTVDTGSYVTTSSFNNFTGSIQGQVDSLTAATASYVTNAQTSSMSVLSSSYALTASYLESAISASFAITASYLEGTASYAFTASYAEMAATASYLSGSITNAVTSSYALTASYASTALTASHAITASYVLGQERFITQGATDTEQIITGSLTITQNLTVLGSASFTFFTSSQTLVNQNTITTFANTPGIPTSGYLVVDSASLSNSASFLYNAVNERWTITKPVIFNNNLTGSLFGSASYALTASYVDTDLGFNFTQTTPALTWTITHGLNTVTPLVQVYDPGYSQIIPASITSLSPDITIVSFSFPRAGYAIASKGSGVAPTIPTASNAVSASYATFAQTIASDLNITASNLLVTNNITASSITAESASFGFVQSITGSAVIIGQEYIVLNTQQPAARYAGLIIYDSGSQYTASVVWDSERNILIYQNATGSTYHGGGFMAGPRNTGSLADVAYPTLNKIVRSQGGDHLYDSNISDDDTTIGLGIDTQVTGSLNVSGGITGSLFGTASWSNNALTASSVPSTAIGFNFIQSASSDTWVIDHNLNNQYPLILVYGSDSLMIIPQSISGSSVNTAIVTFSSARTGYARVV